MLLHRFSYTSTIALFNEHIISSASSHNCKIWRKKSHPLSVHYTAEIKSSFTFKYIYEQYVVMLVIPHSILELSGSSMRPAMSDTDVSLSMMKKRKGCSAVKGMIPGCSEPSPFTATHTSIVNRVFEFDSIPHFNSIIYVCRLYSIYITGSLS